MQKEQKNHPEKQEWKIGKSNEERRNLEDKIDEELEQSFPASDPPSYSQPGNKDIKKGTFEED